jgi:hypothetical protein
MLGPALRAEIGFAEVEKARLNWGENNLKRDVIIVRNLILYLT